MTRALAYCCEFVFAVLVVSVFGVMTFLLPGALLLGFIVALLGVDVAASATLCLLGIVVLASVLAVARDALRGTPLL